MSIFKGRAKRLDDIDLPRVAALIGVGEDEIHAVLDVEAAGSGFDSQGRVKALYEPHIAYREANKRKDKTVLNKLVASGLAYPNWRRDYPKDSYPRIEAAMAIDEDIALRSTSWGLGQIMGFNCNAAGYASPEAMVLAFAEDEESHLEAMVRFIITHELDDEIRRHDWARFARGYNGAGYRANMYDEKLAAAFAKWRKIKDTPWTPETAVEPVQASPAPMPVASPEPPPAATAATATRNDGKHEPPPGFWSRFFSAFTKRISA
jgi:hypothetical protein